MAGNLFTRLRGFSGILLFVAVEAIQQKEVFWISWISIFSQGLVIGKLSSVQMATSKRSEAKS